MTIAFILAAAIQLSPIPGGVQPDPVNHPDWWVPCSHPIAVERGLCRVTPPPPTPGPFVPFKVGRTYTRQEAPDQRLFIAGAGQSPEGLPLLFGLCVGPPTVAFVAPLPASEALVPAPPTCTAIGQVIAMVASAPTTGWVEETP
jgi:hypothetical protein